MKWIKLICGIAYAVSFVVAALLFLEYNIGLNPDKSIYLFVGLGAAGFILNLVSFSKDKHGNPKANLLYWLGSLLIFIGLSARIMQYPFSIELIILGAIIAFFSILRYKKRIAEESQNDDILDQS
jgi:hypothetical protein